MSRTRLAWLLSVAGFSTLVLAALVVFVGYDWLRVLLFGWLPLMLVEFFAAVYAGRPSDRKRWLSFVVVTLAGGLVSAWLVVAEGMVPWKVVVFAAAPFTVLTFFVTQFVKRRVAPYRVVQIIAAVLLNAYVLAYLESKILYQGFFKSLPQPILNCYGGPLAVFACPLGSAQQMVGMKSVPWLALGVFVIVGAFVGRAACAWLCPFGLWQDLLVKIPAGKRARHKRWTAFGVIGGITLAAAALLFSLLHITWWKVLLLGWLPFIGLVLAVLVAGKFDIPKRMWLGGWLAGVGLAALVWFKFGVGFGVATGFFATLLLGLTGRRVGAGIAAVAGLLLGWLGPAGFHVGPLSGLLLGLALAVTGFGLVVVIDLVFKVSLPATYLKYGMLLLVAGLASYLTIEPWFCKLCPQGTFGAGVPLVLWDPVGALRGLVGWLFWVKTAILLLVVVAAIGIKRPFCRLVCPIGAVYSVFNKASLLRLEADSTRCRNCGLCTRVCPMNISVYENANQLECIRCMECVWSCGPDGVKIRA